MTIAAGFNCSDGILLASDTLYSGGVGRRFGRKFWVFERDDVTVVFGGAGLEAALRRTRDEIDRKLQPGMSRIRVVDIIDTALAKVEGKLPTDQQQKTQALVVIRAEGSTLLYESQIGLSMLNTVDHPAQCVGWGSSLGWYFASTLFRPNMPIRWAKVVAANLIKQCKDHSDSCGGQTNLIEIPLDRAPVFIENDAEIAALEDRLAIIGTAMQLVLPDGRANEDTLDHRLGVLNQTIKDLRHMFVITARGELRMNASMSAQSTAPSVTITEPILPPKPQTTEGE